MKLSSHFIFLFLLTLPTIYSTPSCDNPLTSQFGFSQGPLRLKTSTESKHCSSLNGKQTCCKESVFSSAMTAYTDQIAYYTEVYLADREFSAKLNYALLITNTQGTPSLSDLNTAATNLEAALFPPGGPNVVSGDIATKISNLIELVQGWYTTVNGKTATDLQAIYTSVETERKKCLTFVGKVYANIMCLACDANYASVEGVTVQTGNSGPTLTISNGYCADLAENCYDYIDKAVQYGHMVDVYHLSMGIPSALETLLDPTSAYTSNTDVSTALSTFAATNDYAQYLVINREKGKPPRKPNKCVDRTNCPWLCTNLLKKDGTLDKVGLTIGGVADYNWIRLNSPVDADVVAPTAPFWKPDINDGGFDFYTEPGVIESAFGRVLSVGMAFIAMFVVFLL